MIILPIILVLFIVLGIGAYFMFNGKTISEDDIVVNPECGNGIREGEEDCDGNDFGGDSCQLMGYAGGSLRCIDCGIDESVCID